MDKSSNGKTSTTHNTRTTTTTTNTRHLQPSNSNNKHKQQKEFNKHREGRTQAKATNRKINRRTQEQKKKQHARTTPKQNK